MSLVVVVDVVLCCAVPGAPCFYFANYDVIGALIKLVLAASTKSIHMPAGQPI